ncbi:MAG: hypothetical protein ACJ8J7_12050 [Sulfurifustaceae bacterium]
MKPHKLIVFAVACWAMSSVAATDEKKNVPQVPQQETYEGKVTGQTPSSDPGGVRSTAPPGPGAGERQDSVTVVPPGNRTPGAPPGSVAATEPRGSFGEADKNRSGFIEQDEASGIQGLDFTTADADKDGKLSRSEFEAAMRKAQGDQPAASSSGTSGSSGSSGSSGTSGSSTGSSPGTSGSSTTR